MSKSNGTENSIFQTELKDANYEVSKLPPLNPEKKNKTHVADTDNNNDIKNNSNINQINNDESKIDSENNIDSNDNYDESIPDKNNNCSNSNSNFNNDEIDVSDINENNNKNSSNEDNSQNSNNEDNNNKHLSAGSKEEIKIGGEADDLLHEQASSLIGAVVNINNQDKENNKNDSKDIANSTSENASRSNSKNQSTKASQKNSTKSSTANSMRSSHPSSNRSSSSLTPNLYGSSQSKSKTAPAKRRVGKLPSSKISWNQEMSKIPKDILHNPYVTKRLNIFPPRKTNPPKAALSHVEYRNRTAPQKDELTEKILNGEKLEEEPTIEQLKNSAHILRNIEKDFIDKSQYPEAKKASEAFQRTMFLIQKKSSIKEVKTGLEDLISKRNELIILADSKKEDWDDAIAKYQSNTEAHVRDMKQQHQEKIEKFNSEIPTELTPLFKRNSVCYLTMRSNEKYLALNRHFDEAQKIKLKADEIEEIEREENFSKMDEYYRRKREKIKQLQQLEIINYLNYADTRKNELLFQKEKSINPPLSRAEKIDKEIKRICEKRGIKQNQLNFDLVDDERVKLIKSKEKENDEIFQRSENSKNPTKDKQKNKSNESNNNDENQKLNKQKEEEEDENNHDKDNDIIMKEEEEDENNHEENDDVKMKEEEEETNHDENDAVGKIEKDEINDQNDDEIESGIEKVVKEEEEEINEN